MRFKKISTFLVFAILIQIFISYIAVAETPENGTMLFYDVSNHWAKEPIKYLADQGLIKGYLTTNGHIIKPDAYITRAEYLTVLLNTKSNLQILDNKVKTFSDVKTTDWFKEAVDKASSNGILEGYPDGSFRPNNPITRAEIAALVAKINNWSQKDIHTDISELTDISQNSWYYTSVAVCKLKGIINGYPDGTFRPEKNALRGEAFALLSNYIKNVVEPSKHDSSEQGHLKDKSSDDYLYVIPTDFNIFNENQKEVTIQGLVDKENASILYYHVRYFGFDITTPKHEKNNVKDGLVILGPDEEEKGLFNENKTPYRWEIKDFKLNKDYFKIDIILVIEDQYGNKFKKTLVNINDKDSDGDGVSDYEEIYIYNTDPLNPDTDGDGLSDYEEIRIFATDPLNPDTDGDGLDDYAETKVWVILELGVILPIFYNSPEYEQYGMEGVMLVAEKYGYKEEQIIMGLDPLNPDTDGDGLPDGYEFRVLGTDPTRHITYGMDVADVDLDIDGDGITNQEKFLNEKNQ